MTKALNADPGELEKFSALAKQWWDKNGPMGPLHAINPLRMSFIEQQEDLEDLKVLDVGCGGGILTEALARAGALANGLDLASDALAAARVHAEESGLNIQYHEQPVEEHAAAHAGQYDVITCMEMLEHVPSPSSIVNSCAQLLKPGGRLYLSTINRNPKAFALAVVGAEYVLNMIPKGTHEYAKFIKPSELATWCRQSGLDVQGTAGLHYNPVSRSYLLNKDVSVNYLMRCLKSA